MRTPMSPAVTRLVVLASLLALVVPGVTAATEAPGEASFDVDADLPITFDGAVTLGAASPALLVSTIAGDIDWSLSATDTILVEVEHWEHTASSTAGLDGPAAGIRTTEHDLGPSGLALVERLDGFTALVWGDDATTVQTATAPGQDTADPLGIHRLAHEHTIASHAEAPEDQVLDAVLGRPVPFRYDVPEGAFHVQAKQAHHVLSGDLQGYLYGAQLRLTAPTGAWTLILDERIEEHDGSVYVPGQGWSGPGTHEERVLRYAQFTTKSATLDSTILNAGSALFAPALQIGLDGRLTAPRVTGAVISPDGELRRLADDPFVIEGTSDATLSPARDPGQGHLQGQGQLTYLRTGSAAGTYEIPLVATASLAAAIVGVLAAAAWKLQGAGVGVALFSRVTRSAALGHKTRSAVYEIVQRNPGIATHEIVTQIEAGWSTVTYHLEVLERTELLIGHKDGRYKRYFDRTTGRFANGRKRVVAVLQNDTTATIAHAIRAEPGLVQRRLAERLGLAPSSINWHVARLVEAGLVEKERAARCVALLPGPAWASLDEAESGSNARSHAVDADSPLPGA